MAFSERPDPHEEALEADLWRAMERAKVTCDRPVQFIVDVQLAARRYAASRGTVAINDDIGSVSPQQQRAIHAACAGMDRAKRLATISDIVGRQVASSNELSYTEAARVLGKLSGARA